MGARPAMFRVVDPEILAMVGVQLAKIGGQRPRRKESWKHKLDLMANLHLGDELECRLRDGWAHQNG